MTWAYFASEIETAAKTSMDADAAVGTSGTLAVITRELELIQPDGDNPETFTAIMPYVGIRCVGSGARLIGTRTLLIEHELRMRVIVEGNTTSTAYILASKIAETCARVIRDQSASSSWLSSAHQVLIDDWSCTGPESDEDNPFRFSCLAKVSIGVIYPEA